MIRYNLVQHLTQHTTWESEKSDKVSKGAKIRNRYNQVPHLTQDTKKKNNNNKTSHTREPRGEPFPSR